MEMTSQKMHSEFANGPTAAILGLANFFSYIFLTSIAWASVGEMDVLSLVMNTGLFDLNTADLSDSPAFLVHNLKTCLPLSS